jgi:hypothetical protein
MKPCFRTFVLLLCLCALTLRLSGMHMHVALDHDEAPHLHIDAFGSHDTPADVHGETEHLDQGHIEVSLDGGALSKKLGIDLVPDTLFFIAILSCLLFVLRTLNLLRTGQFTLPDKQFAYLRPPLRGPPLQACINS